MILTIIEFCLFQLFFVGAGKAAKVEHKQEPQVKIDSSCFYRVGYGHKSLECNK
jgi:hypothetical protein